MQTRQETLVRGVCVLPEMCLYTRIVCKTHLVFASINGTFGDEIFQSDNTIRQRNLVDRVPRRGSIFVSVFYKIKLSI